MQNNDSISLYNKTTKIKTNLKTSPKIGTGFKTKRKIVETIR